MENIAGLSQRNRFMNQAMIPDPLRVHIAGLSEPTELRDETGRVLGVFIPAICWSRGDWTFEELEAALNEADGRSVDEVLHSMGAK